MANIVRLKRRAAGGAAGAPSSLKTTEVAYNEQDDVLYIGFGDDGSGNATSIRAVAGAGAFLRLTTNQSIAGVKSFSSSPIVPTPTADTEAANKAYVDNAVGEAGGGDMMKATYDPTNKNADAFSMDNMVEGSATKILTGTERTKLTGIEAGADVTDAANVATAINGSAAKTTPVTNDRVVLMDSAASNVLKYMTYGNLLTAISSAVTAAIIDSAPGTLDTLNELAAALGDDPNFASTITSALAAKAPLASPVFTGNPQAPTPTAGDNDTSIATTAFVQTAIAGATIDGGTF